MNYLDFYNNTPKYTHEPGLSVMEALMHRLGDPQDKLSCIHIAGTNGKGSCAAMTAAVLQTAGYKTGLFTSPDLVEMRERIQINSVYITEVDFAAATEKIKTASAGLPEPSYFEKLTAAAFLYFAEQGCERVVLETGLGGRLDATNIIKNPLVSVIMPVGTDHTAVLGNTIFAIAAEKAGIIKPGCPVVCAPQVPEAKAVIENTCTHRGAALHQVDIKNILPLSHTPAGQHFSYRDMIDIKLSLLGAHQTENAVTVIEVCRLLGVSDADIRLGLNAAKWQCRLEYFPGKPPVILDGAHNSHGCAALLRAMDDYFPGQKFTMIMGVMKDKDYISLLRMSEPYAARYIFLTPDSPRALPAAELSLLVHAVPAYTADTPEQALCMARTYNSTICAFGSLYYIGHLRRCITMK